MNRYQEYTFARGFLLSKTPTKSLEGWEEINVGSFYLYFHHLTKWGMTYKDADNWSVVIGNIYDVINETTDLKEVSKYILSESERSESHLFDYIEELNGRYVIINSLNGVISTLTDATGMKALFYHTNFETFASHAKLITMIEGEEVNKDLESKWLSYYSAYHLPGNVTIYEDIYQLIPNHLINISEQKVKRFYPRKDLQSLSIDDAADLLINEINKHANLMSEDGLILSLSGGIDSRLSLALLKNKSDKLKLFTYFMTDSDDKEYTGNPILNLDQKIAGDIADNLNLEHRFLEIDNARFKGQDFQDFKSVMYNNTYLSHNQRVAKLYYENYGNEVSDFLHVRSNTHGIGKAFFRKAYNFKGKNMKFEDQVTCYSPKAVNDETINRIYEEYNEQFDPRVAFNYDPFDLVFWETRLGMWHSHILIESDPAFESHTILNSHKIYEILLSVSLFDRKKSNLFLKAIEKAWPVLRFWDINKDLTLLSRYDEQILDYGDNVKQVEFTSGNSNKNGQPKIFSEKTHKSFKFYIDQSAPKKGDFAQAEIPIPQSADNPQKEIVLNVRSPYESSNLSNRLIYQVLVDDKAVVEEDIAHWKETNQIVIPIDLTERKTLQIKVLALRNCEDWNFGKAGTIICERLVVRNQTNKNSKVTVSSPHSKIHRKKI